MSALALPNRRVEAWKYSDLRAALADQDFAVAGEGEVIERLAEGVGRRQTRSLAPGEERVQVEYLEAGGLYPVAEEVRLPPGAKYHRVVIQTGPDVPLSFCRVHLAAGAQFRQFVLAEGARLARIETHVEIEGEGAEVELNGVYLAGAGRHADLTSRITHHAPHGRTSQLIKGAARAKGRGVFQGKILVDRGAQKTDARQGHHALLLEEGAEIDAKPELEIYADDVACAHGNTAGALSAEQLFYLRARGIPEREARALLVEAFLGEAVSEWLPEALREEALARIRAWLEAG